jgi:hypothetical protein
MTVSGTGLPLVKVPMPAFSSRQKKQLHALARCSALAHASLAGRIGPSAESRTPRSPAENAIALPSGIAFKKFAMMSVLSSNKLRSLAVEGANSSGVPTSRTGASVGAGGKVCGVFFLVEVVCAGRMHSSAIAPHSSKLIMALSLTH